MTGAEALDLTQSALWVSLTACAPIVVAVMLVGIIISLLQALTQVQEMTLTFVPKIIVAVIVLAVSSPYIAQVMLKFTEQTYSRIQQAHDDDGMTEPQTAQRR